MLTEKAIKFEAALGTSYTKGCRYFQNDAVRELHYFSQNNIFEARVQGRELYTVTVQINRRQAIDYYDCDCPAFYSYNGACKHIIAVLKKIQKEWDTYFGVGKALPPTRATQELLAFFQNETVPAAEPVNKGKIKLIPTYSFANSSGVTTNWLEFLIGRERMYVLKDIPQLLAVLDSNQEISYGKSFTLTPRNMVFDDLSKALLNLLRQAYAEEKQRVAWSYSYYSSAGSAFAEPKRFRLTNSNLARFFAAVGGQPFTVILHGEKITDVRLQEGRPPLQLAAKATDGGLKLAMKEKSAELYGLDTDFRYLYYKRGIYKVDDQFASYIKPLLRCFRENRKPETFIPSAAVSDFFSATLPALETISSVTVDNAVYDRFYKEPLEKYVYFDKLGDGMSARIEFRYGALSINPAEPSPPAESTLQGKWLLRSTAEENRVLRLFRQHGFTESAGKFVQADEEATYCFLQQSLPELHDIAEIFYSDDFKPVSIKSTSTMMAGVRLNTETDMLELSLHYDQFSPRELRELLAACKLKKRYHRLQNGGFIPLDSPDFQAAAGLVEQLGLRSSDIEKQVIELPKYRALYLDSLARETADFHMERSSAFKRMVQDIHEPQDAEYPLPPGIRGRLRDYQKTGFKWLKTLASYGLGGILADDMGLGKTLQVLTFILSEKATSSRPCLVIAPTSLLYNWQEEVLKFTPELNVTVITGQQSDRLEQLRHIDQTDLVVTSYGLLKRDIAFYETKSFHACFLDEAQHVKNPNTLNAKSVKKIKAKNYFALTGTPIENTLTELWSIFDFLMPGYLRTHKAFISRFEAPIIKNGDQTALRELGRHISPFILRRMKKAVLKELPEKVESKMVNEMTAEQSKLYAAWLLQARTEFETEVQAHGFEKSRIKILSLLTRLRQICCHPSLFIENYHGGCGKLDMLLELLKDAVSGGHRILLFSQYTGMLSLIQPQLAAMKMTYHYLDGSTKAEDRVKLVHAFNAGEKNIFLISLKAGGTGLNLTGADMVIHYDPWWNPAVEDQATDRAYRIGQKNSVQVYKLITKNTIEEKIYSLQQKKKELINSLIQPGETFLTKMNESEIRDLFTF
ncbi:MAG: DEAD/DEAH box helicase [Veillonellales bacterium]